MAQTPRFESRFLLVLAALASLSLAACQRTVDMPSVQDPSWIATTIPYVGMREEIRQYPDYSIINASVLTAAATGASGARSGGGQGAPR